MAQASIKKNFAYKSALNLSSYVIGFITFPYISRLMGAERVGLVNFVDNTVSYFLLFASLGIGLLGVREIARVRCDERERSRVFANLLGINLLFTLLTLVVFVAAVCLVPTLRQYSDLFWVGSAKIIFTALLVEWFFSGMENFRYITLRTVAVKLLYVVAVFLFVRRADQYPLYFILTVGVVVVNALINMLYARRFVKLRLGDLFSLRYLKSNCTLGIYSIMTSMYLTFNVMFLGFVAGNTEVGYYTIAFKLYTVFLGFFSAFANVMLPRMSALVADGEREAFQTLLSKSFSAVATFSLPLIACSIVMAPQIIYVIAGEGFAGAVVPMQIIMPALLAVGLAQILAIQILMPLRRDGVLLRASVIGATLSVVINVACVPHLGATGSAVVLLAAESIVTATYIVYVCRHHIVKIPFGRFLRSALLTLPSVAVCVACGHYISNPFIALAVALPLSVGCWGILNFRELRSYFGI